MAECIINKVGGRRFVGYSAGSDPKGEIHPYALGLLNKLNYPTNDLRSKSWDEFAQPDAPPLDFVISVCDNAAQEVCPIWPGQHVSAHWGLPDPAAVSGTEAEKRSAFNDAHSLIHKRISIFVDLPLQSLDKLTLQNRLSDIGKTIPTAV
jgi:protein-tyrosine-phosphatase